MRVPVLQGVIDYIVKTHSVKRFKDAIHNKITQWLIYILILVLPLLVIPYTNELMDYGKEFVLVIVVLLASISWLILSLSARRFEFQFGKVSFLLVLFVIALGFSTLFSLAKGTSFVGFHSQEYLSLLTTIMFVLLFFLLHKQREDHVFIVNAILALIFSSIISLAFFFLTFVDIFVYQGNTQIQGFSTLGNHNTLAFFSITVMMAALGLFTACSKGESLSILKDRKRKIFGLSTALLTLLNIILLLMIDFWILWITMLVGVFVFVLISMVQKQKVQRNLASYKILWLLLGLSVIFLFISHPYKPALPIMASPSTQLSISIAKDVLKQDVKSFILGSGPGTYLLDFRLYKDPQINNTQFWSLQLDHGRSYVMTLLPTIGVLGILIWLIIMASILKASFAYLVRSKNSDPVRSSIVIALLGAWTMLLAASFLYPSNLSLQFLFWLISGLLASQVFDYTIEKDFSRSPKMIFAMNALCLVAVIGGLFFLTFKVQNVRAEVHYKNAIVASKASDIDPVILSVGNAVKLNPYKDLYYRTLSIALLKKASLIVNTVPYPDLPPQQKQVFSSLIDASLFAASKAIDISPNDSSNWSVFGKVQRDLIAIVDDANNKAVRAFDEAVRTDPVNPTHHFNKGRTFLLVADRSKHFLTSDDTETAKIAKENYDKALSEAERAFQAAISLKSDYMQAHYNLAAVLERQDRLAEAEERLKSIRDVFPNDVKLSLQLAVLSIRMEKIDVAQKELERLLIFAPQYSNARWYLSYIYESQGERDKAIEQVDTILESNPGNALALDRLAQLQGTEPPEPLENIKPIEPDDFETPDEVLEIAPVVDDEPPVEEDSTDSTVQDGEDPIIVTEE